MNKEIRQSFAILKKVYFDGAFAGIELNKTIRREFGNVNTKLITKIVYGVIEKNIFLDYVIDKFVKKSPSKDVSLILKTGAYIIKFINSIPVFACVNELVEMTKTIDNKAVAGFVNATLKKIASTEVSLPKKDNIVKYFSVKYSKPEWLIEKFIKEHDKEFVESLLSKELTTLTHIRVLENLIGINEFFNILEKNKITFEKSGVLNTIYVEYSELLKVCELKDKYVVQGLPSIIVAKNIEKDSKNVLDLCASPGGKSILIAQSDKNVKVTSCDVSEGRLELIKKYARSCDVNNIDIKLNDATILNEEWIEKFDTVLCDVPCSNMGIANKKPDVLLSRTNESISELPELQLKILEVASKYVKRGGILLYSTCSIMKDENEIVVGKFLKNNKNFIIDKVDTMGVNVENYHNLVTFYPHISNCEGFFIGRLRKQ